MNCTFPRIVTLYCHIYLHPFICHVWLFGVYVVSMMVHLRATDIYYRTYIYIHFLTVTSIVHTNIYNIVVTYIYVYIHALSICSSNYSTYDYHINIVVVYGCMCIYIYIIQNHTWLLEILTLYHTSYSHVWDYLGI